nr:tyrosine-type recombinase/integrase [Clostridium amylolyticum]
MARKTNYTKNGIDYFRVTATVGKDGNGKPIRKEFLGKCKTEAEGKRDDYLNGIKNGLNVDFKDVALGPLMHMWLFEIIRVDKNIKPPTFSRYEGVFRKYIKDSEIYGLKLNGLKTILIQRYYNKLYKNGTSSYSINYLNKLLCQFFNYAVEENYILKNPCKSRKSIVIPGEVKLEDEEDSLEYFTTEEIEKLKAALEGHSLKGLVLLALGTGMRRGELLGLAWTDINYKNLTITVKRTVSRTHIIESDGSRVYKTIVQTPKTKSSIRKVSFPEKLIPILKEVEVKQKKAKMKAGSSYIKQDYDFVFTTASGNLLNVANVSRSWSNLLSKNKIPHRKFHALRHTFATQLFAKGQDVEVVSKLLGHSSSEITRKTYIHVLPEDKVSSVALLNDLFG